MGQWQPIETAPKDGTKVDMWRVHYRTPDVFWSNGEDWWCVDGKFMQSDPVPLGTSPEPTHWQPLPEPPKPR